MAEGGEKAGGGGMDIGGYDSESEDNDAAQDQAAAMAAAAGIDMGGYDFGNPGSDDDQAAMAAALGNVDQDTFNAVMGITDKNPYGKYGMFNKYNPDYTNMMDLQTRRAIANNMYSKFVNPYNDPSIRGYNPAFASGDMERGILRSGVKKGFSAINPATGLAENVVGYRSEMSPLGAGLAGLASLAIPGAGLLANMGTTVKGFESQAPIGPSGQPLGRTSGGILGGILDTITGGTTQAGKSALQSAISRAENMIGLSPEARATESKGISPMGQSNDITRQGIMDALMGGVNNARQNPSQMTPAPDFGIAGMQTADASNFANQTSPFGLSYEQIGDMIQGNGVTTQGTMGQGQYNLNVDPFGKDKGFQFNFSMPLRDLGLGSLISQNNPQAPANEAFDIAQANNTRGGFFSGNYRGNRTQNQGGGMFGVPGTKARLYQPSQKGSATGSGNAGMFDKMAQMFKTGIFG